MTFDLQRALHRKGEWESARLDDFAFRLRARTMKRLAASLDIPAGPLLAAIAREDDPAIVARLTADHGTDAATCYAQALADAEAALIAELGDPTPVRLA